MARWLPLLVIGSLAWPGGAGASVFELFGGGGRSSAMAGAMAAAAHGPEAAFHNPAMLSESSYGAMSLGFTATAFATDVRLSRPVCTDTYATCRKTIGPSFSHRAPKQPPANYSVQFGWHAPLAGALKKRVSIAALLTLPLGRVLSISGPDPQTPHQYMYEGLPDRFALLLAVSARPTDWLSIGIGTQILASLSSDVKMMIDVNNHVMDRAEVDVRLQPLARLVAGAAVRLLPGVRLGASYRQEVNFSYDIPSDIDIGTSAKALLAVQQKTLYTPNSLHFGASWIAPSGRLQVALTLSYAMWASAPDPSPRVEIDLSGSSLDAVGLGDVLDTGQEAAPIRLRMQNTWTPSGGIEYRAADAFKVRGGYAFRPTPAPRAVGPWNYLDNDAHVVGLGADIGFGEAIRSRAPGRSDGPVRIDYPLFVRIAAQTTVLPRRTVRKNDPNDPVGDFEHDGVLWHGNLAVGGAW